MRWLPMALVITLGVVSGSWAESASGINALRDRLVACAGQKVDEYDDGRIEARILAGHLAEICADKAARSEVYSFSTEGIPDDQQVKLASQFWSAVRARIVPVILRHRAAEAKAAKRAN